MSLLTNNNTIHLYNRWCSPWYENSNIYSNLIYSDLYIYELINGIYYQLNIPTSIPFYKELSYNQLIIRVNAHIFKKRRQKRSSLFYNNKTNFFYNYKKIMFLLHKILFQKKQFKKKFIINNTKISNNYSIFNKYFFITKKYNSIDISNKLLYNFYFLKTKKNRKNNKFVSILKSKKNINFYNKKIFILLKYKNSNFFFIKKKRLYQKKKLYLTKKKKKFKQLFGKRKNKFKKKRKNRKLVNKNKFKNKKYKRKLSRIVKFKKKKKKIKLIKISKKKKRSKKYRKNKNIFNINLNIFLFFYNKLLCWYYLLLIKLLITFHMVKIININTINNFTFYDKYFNILKNKIINNFSYCNITIYNITCKFYKKLYWFNNYYFYILLNNLRYKFIHTLNIYLGLNVVYLPYYKRKFFNLQDVKLVNDYIKIKLQSKRSIVRIMRKLVKIYSFQRYKTKIRNVRYGKKIILFKKKINKKLNFNKYLFRKNDNIKRIFVKKKRLFRKKLVKWKHKFKYFNYKHYPLVGIRIECNGPTKKGKRTKMVTYNEWVNYYKLPGKMPYTTKMADVHYWQNYARTKRAAIGIKIWLFFNTLLYTFKTRKQKNIKIKL